MCPSGGYYSTLRVNPSPYEDFLKSELDYLPCADKSERTLYK